MSFSVNFTGRSGRQYTYWSIDNPTAQGILAVSGNYAFVKQLRDGTFLPLYFGVADDLSARIPNHERLAEAVKLGATHVMGHSTPTGGNEQTRLAEERDLIQYWNPSLNVQHRTTG